MKGLLYSTVLVVVLGLLVLSCEKAPNPTAVSLSENPNGALSKNNVVHHVSVGSPDACEAFGLPPGCDANFSLVANMYADGSVSGEWQDTFAGGGGGVGGIHVAV
ncbi:MAG: hypothetical protein ACREBU_17670, partial [Nitrososphaera sp.]